MAKATAIPGWQRALVMLTGTVIGVVVLAVLYWAQVVFIPLALAIFLSFLLNPLVTHLKKHHVGRLPAVVVVVLLVSTLLAGLGWIATRQVTSLLGELPNYTANIKAKIKSLQDIGGGSARLEHMIDEITLQLKGKPNQTAVVLQLESPVWVGRLPGYLVTALEFLGGLALALLLAVFMLLKREDLRNRFIRLVGQGQLTFTTKAVDEAGDRISRYLLMQLAVNASYGLILALGLFLIGVPHALLWGLLAAVLRYIPYLGAWLAAVLILTLSLAMFAGWLQPLLVLGVIVVLELVTSNLIEPWVYGHSLGVSEVALLFSAAFWAFLWGPIGLILSGPLTVCLVVLGRYVPQLRFLEVLLGDEPALETDVSYYQRLLARDQDEAAALVLARARTASPEQVYDELLMPALNYVKRDRERDELTEADEQFVLRATRAIVEDLGESQAAANTANARSLKTRLLGCPGHDEADALALEMLRQVLDPARWEMDILPVEILSAEMVARVTEKDPAIVCIGALPPGGLAHTHHLCKRLRARLPKAQILVGRWGLQDNVEQNSDQLREAGADRVETSLVQTRDYLNAWLPVLSPAEATPATNGVALDARVREG